MSADGETPRDRATASTRSMRASGIRIETIWRIVSDGSSGARMIGSRSKPTFSCSTLGARSAVLATVRS
ncbi:MAG: hypothetical protein M3537_04000 [Chloroflexota bacterium]|nr:hypothetical protein [Chloroflexota bacterium]